MSLAQIIGETVHIGVLAAVTVGGLVGWHFVTQLRRESELNGDRQRTRSLRRREFIVACLTGIPSAMLLWKIMANMP